ncbi:hypothetical protein HYW46_02285 [Candidatus Daviesbacteria bacterium]|nr:hypothetical protein [Candidatus Daviesbacteria bacterium]
MTLSPENMQTDPTGNVFCYAPMEADITHMDKEQLDKYIRMTFMGRTDTKTLPYPFWGTYYEAGFLGGSDGHSPAGPNRLFGNIYSAVGRIQREGKTSFTAQSRNEVFEYPADFGYRLRLEKVLTGILDESQNVDGNPTPEQVRLGIFAAATIQDIALSDGPNSPEQQFVGMLQEKGTTTIGVVRQMVGKLKHPKSEDNPLFARADTFLRDPRFGSLYQAAMSSYNPFS